MYRVCPHCCETVSTKVYKDHERLFYNKDDKTWITLSQMDVGDGNDAGSAFPSPPATVLLSSGIQPLCYNAVLLVTSFY